MSLVFINLSYLTLVDLKQKKAEIKK